MKKLLKKAIEWLEEKRELNRLYRLEHRYTTYSHPRLDGLNAVANWAWRVFCRGFWWMIEQLKSRCG
jgi:hypothetical protein